MNLKIAKSLNYAKIQLFRLLRNPTLAFRPLVFLRKTSPLLDYSSVRN
jgi:hypothetical protein